MSIENKTMDFPFEIKEVSEDGIFTGYASTFGGKPDSQGDVIRPGAFTESLAKGGYAGDGIKMLWQHNTGDPIGDYPLIEENNRGLKVKGALALGIQKADEAHILLKKKIIRSLSIGFRIENYKEDTEYDDNKRIRYLNKIALYEISLVTFPANTRATITSVKSMIEKATSERELERALRDVGLSPPASRYIVSLCKDKLLSNLRESEIDILDADVKDVIENDSDNGNIEDEGGEESGIESITYLGSILEKFQTVNSSLEEKEEKRVVPYKSYPTLPLSTRWDGNAEIRKADVGELKKMSTWYDADEPDVKSSYKLPHHKAGSFSLVWRGVTAAMAALLGARGGVDVPDGDRQKIYDHLKKHYVNDFDKEAPEFKDYSISKLKELFPEMFEI